MPGVTAIIIGAGQAGLAMSHRLSRHQIDHVLLERGRVAARWYGERWDSLRLLTPNWMSRLPVWTYQGNDPDGFMTAQEFGRHLEAYARASTAPVQHDTEVLSVQRHACGYRVSTTARAMDGPRGGSRDRPLRRACPAMLLVRRGVRVLVIDRAAYHRILATIVPEIAGTLASRRPDSPLSVYAGRKGFLKKPFGPGWALVGDAGFFKDPQTAHGITDALRDASLLAHAATARDRRAFANYAAVRDELSTPIFAATETIASFPWSLDTVQALHAALNRAMKTEVLHMASLCDPEPRDGFDYATGVGRFMAPLEETAA